jgi:hypothetical protein
MTTVERERERERRQEDSRESLSFPNRVILFVLFIYRNELNECSVSTDDSTESLLSTPYRTEMNE